MAPVIPSYINNVSLVPGVPFINRKNECSKRFNLVKCSIRPTSSSQKIILPLSTSLRLFPQFRTPFTLYKPKATGTEVVVEEADSAVTNEDAPSSTSEESSAKSKPVVGSAQSNRPKPTRKSEMPPVKPEDLVPGATFTGKVRSIQPFGAFVDFGAFTDGLVHVSQLSDNFVKDVNSVVSIGQEVKVKLVEANMETSRISLTMRENSDTTKPNFSPSTDKSRPPRKGPPRSNQKRDDPKKASKFAKGQDLEGTVKNLTRSGAFISLPEGEEGFLPQAEEIEEGFANMMGGSTLQVGQEVSVRVLRITRGQVTLTMKKEEAAGELDSKLSQGMMHSATNPFFLAFRKNKDIASFLDERVKEEQPTETELVEAISSIDEVADDEIGAQIADDSESQEKPVEDETIEGKVEISSEITSTEMDVSVSEEVPAEIAEETVVTDSLPSEEVAEIQSGDSIAKDEVEVPQSNARDEVVVPTIPEDEKLEAKLDDNENEDSEKVENVIEEVSESQKDEDKQIENENDDTQAKFEIENETPESETVSASLVEDVKVDSVVEEIIEAKSEVENGTPDTDSEAPSNMLVEDVKVDSTVEEASKVAATISPALVKQLREETGAGMMDCKKALSETGGDLVKAQEFLRKKGLSSADKKASRATAEGRIGSYIHDNRIGVLVEVNCETDFVSRGEIFKELVDDLAMQVAACPQVQYLVTDDVDKELVEKERAIELQKEDLLSKPEQIREKIVDGRINKRLEELALLEQPYIKNDKMVVKDWVKQTIATVGENIKVKRFVRFNLGEGLEKKSQDFAAEVAAQTAAKSAPSPVAEQPAIVVEEPAVVEAPKAAVSAALVKQLREETGAGMMDCKKALSETGGDLEKAQEYLRKKGLSSADKKSSRLAAEGRIGSYIHDNRIGVLLEVNCETDFVGRSEKFKELVDNLAMQVVACPQVQYISIEDIPEIFVKREKEMEMQRDDLQSKPESIREKIVEGRVSKRLGELALLEQAFIKDDSILVKDLVKQTVAGLGENIKVRRFIRFTLGEESNESSKADDEE